MKKYFYLFLITLVIIVTSIAYMGNNTNHLNHYEKLEIFSDSSSSSSSNDNIKYNFLNQYPNMLNCNINYSKMAPINNNNNNNNNSIKYNYSQPANHLTHDYRILRAIIVYFPIEKSTDFEPEFKWMYRSWIEMQKYEPIKWRTDIIVFINTDNDLFKKNANFFLNSFNCSLSNRRKSSLDKPMCTLIKYIPFKQRFVQNYETNIKENKEKYDFMLKQVNIYNDDQINLLPFYAFLKRITNYGYLDSILMAFDGWNYFKLAGYNFLIRSDMDVFLTPLFGQWLPRYCNDFYVGRGGYSAAFNTHRLERIASNIGFEYASETNLGSTWYSTPDQFRIVSYLTLFGMAYLSDGKFLFLLFKISTQFNDF